MDLAHLNLSQGFCIGSPHQSMMPENLIRDKTNIAREYQTTHGAHKAGNEAREDCEWGLWI